MSDPLAISDGGPTDEVSTFGICVMLLQVRPGTGGEEASLFALDLWSMYQRFAALQGWRFEVNSLTLSEGGGCKHGSAAISGKKYCHIIMVFVVTNYLIGRLRNINCGSAAISGMLHCARNPSSERQR